jgi:hypothetical protein
VARQVRVQIFAIANHIHAAPSGNGSGAGYAHTLERCREAFTPFARIGILEDDGTLRSPDGIWSMRDCPPHCYWPFI